MKNCITATHAKFAIKVKRCKKKERKCIKRNPRVNSASHIYKSATADYHFYNRFHSIFLLIVFLMVSKLIKNQAATRFEMK